MRSQSDWPLVVTLADGQPENASLAPLDAVAVLPAHGEERIAAAPGPAPSWPDPIPRLRLPGDGTARSLPSASGRSLRPRWTESPGPTSCSCATSGCFRPDGGQAERESPAPETAAASSSRYGRTSRGRVPPDRLEGDGPQGPAGRRQPAARATAVAGARGRGGPADGRRRRRWPGQARPGDQRLRDAGCRRPRVRRRGGRGRLRPPAPSGAGCGRPAGAGTARRRDAGSGRGDHLRAGLGPGAGGARQAHRPQVAGDGVLRRPLRRDRSSRSRSAWGASPAGTWWCSHPPSTTSWPPRPRCRSPTRTRSTGAARPLPCWRAAAAPSACFEARGVEALDVAPADLTAATVHLFREMRRQGRV